MKLTSGEVISLLEASSDSDDDIQVVSIGKRKRTAGDKSRAPNVFAEDIKPLKVEDNESSPSATSKQQSRRVTTQSQSDVHTAHQSDSNRPIEGNIKRVKLEIKTEAKQEGEAEVMLGHSRPKLTTLDGAPKRSSRVSKYEETADVNSARRTAFENSELKLGLTKVQWETWKVLNPAIA